MAGSLVTSAVPSSTSSTSRSTRKICARTPTRTGPTWRRFARKSVCPLASRPKSRGISSPCERSPTRPASPSTRLLRTSGTASEKRTSRTGGRKAANSARTTGSRKWHPRTSPRALPSRTRTTPPESAFAPAYLRRRSSSQVKTQGTRRSSSTSTRRRESSVSSLDQADACGKRKTRERTGRSSCWNFTSPSFRR